MRLVDDLHLRQITSGYEQQLELCERHQEEREISILQLRDVKHNMKNNLISILAYAENREYEKIIKFVNEIMEEGGMTISPITNSGNIVIDSLIGYWYVTAQKQEIDFSVNMNIPMKMPFKGADICLIIGNLLENAVEAAKKVVGKKYIKVQMKYDKGNFLFFVKNNYNGKLLKTKNDRLRSTKLDAGNHGLGLPSVYRAAAKYHGSVFIDDSTPELFQVHVVLYGEQE
jgi:sensor histidine kinase YesM